MGTRFTLDDLNPAMRAQAERQLAAQDGRREIEFRPVPADLTAADIRALPPAPCPQKPAKYRNTRVQFEGEWYDSILELEMCLSFRARWIRSTQSAWSLALPDGTQKVFAFDVRVRDVAWFTRQVPFRLEGGVVYRADALVSLTVSPFVEVWDAKGVMLQTAKNKLKQVRDRYGITVQIYSRRGAE